LATDGFYGAEHLAHHFPITPGLSDIDLDQNGLPDIDEPGKGMDWIRSHWRNGVRKLVERIRELMGNEKFLIINNGVNFKDHPYLSVINAVVCEYWAYEYSWDWERGMLENFLNRAVPPIFGIAAACPRWDDPFRPSETKNYYELVRFTLTKNMLGNIYHSYQETYNPLFEYVRLYDEYELDIGYPTTGMLQLGNSNIWVRFFDKGVAICNISGQDKTITDADLQTLTGYHTGGYFRFLGGQDPAHNNGEKFMNITLMGGTWHNGGITVGDGIILTTEPTVAIIDVIVDNVDAGTNPGSSKAALSGSWREIFEKNDSYYVCIWQAANIAHTTLSGYHIANGLTDAKAVYAPTIGIPGLYTVYEWHGHHNGQEASNVKYTINHAGGSLDLIINQKRNQGQWNELGTFYFNTGTSGNVTISAEGADGVVIADAIKFEYSGSSEPDNTPPNPVRNLTLNNRTENSIFISWNPPLEAEDGDIASFYYIYRDEDFISSTQNLSFLDQNLSENTSYTYTVYSIDKAGNRSQTAPSITAQTLADVTPPEIVSVVPENLSIIIVKFSEPVTKITSELISNYRIQSGITMYSAQLQPDNKTVKLTTSLHNIGQPYTLIVNGVTDVSAAPNMIAPESSMQYHGYGGEISITIATDDIYELYLNGQLLGTGNQWQTATTYSGPAISGSNVIAVKGIDLEDAAGVVAVIEYNELTYVTNDLWRVSTTLHTGWELNDFDDIGWMRATSYGLHGVAKPWADYTNVSGMPTNKGVEWIWSSDNLNDQTIYLRYTIPAHGNIVRPNPPTGLRVRSSN
jgi:hypothetical protein